MAKIAIDCDGVLANFTRGFYEEAHNLFPGVVPVDYQPADWNDFGGLSSASVNLVWKRIRSSHNWWLSLRAYSDNVGALAKFFITKALQDVYICTSRVETVGATVAMQTSMWLNCCGVSYVHNYLGIVPVPKSSQKKALYKALEVEYSIDDKGETVIACDTLEGHKAYLLDRPWNQEYRPKRRVKSVEEFLDAVHD